LSSLVGAVVVMNEVVAVEQAVTDCQLLEKCLVVVLPQKVH
jgi:hypothetical protein